MVNYVHKPNSTDYPTELTSTVSPPSYRDHQYNYSQTIPIKDWHFPIIKKINTKKTNTHTQPKDWQFLVILKINKKKNNKSQRHCKQEPHKNPQDKVTKSQKQKQKWNLYLFNPGCQSGKGPMIHAILKKQPNKDIYPIKNPAIRLEMQY